MMLCRWSTRQIFLWVVLIMMLVLATGCGHRSSHVTHQHGKKAGKALAGTLQPNLSTGSKNADGTAAMLGGEGYFPEGSAKVSDLLEEDPMIREDKKFGKNQLLPGSSNDYWVNRTRAEQLTAQAGLQDVHFEFDSFDLDDEAKAILSANAEWLKANPHAEVTIEGHCDDRGTASYNQVLGEKRALRTKNYLSSLGVSSERLHVMSFGKDNPACWDSTERCHHQNRRAHLVLDISVASTAMQYSGGRID